MEPRFVPLALQNQCLRTLGQAGVARLNLSLVQFKANDALLRAGQTMRHVMFIVSGVLSAATEFHDGGCVGSGLIGTDGILGLGGLYERNTSRLRVRALTNGLAYMCRTDDLRLQLEQHAELGCALLRQSQAHVQQAMTLSACSAIHSVGQRVARWLLCFDRLNAGGPIPITQSLLSEELGVRRTTVTLMLERLREIGAISSRRSQIVIQNRDLLMQQACACAERIACNDTEIPHREVNKRHADPPLVASSARLLERRSRDFVH